MKIEKEITKNSSHNRWHILDDSVSKFEPAEDKEGPSQNLRTGAAGSLLSADGIGKTIDKMLGHVLQEVVAALLCPGGAQFAGIRRAPTRNF